MTGSNTSIRTKTRHPADFFTYVAIYVCAILSVALLLGIIVYVFVKGIRSVNWEFLTSDHFGVKRNNRYCGKYCKYALYHNCNHADCYPHRCWCSGLSE